MGIYMVHIAVSVQSLEVNAMKLFAQKAVVYLVVAFCLFYLITRPADAAHAVKAFFGIFESLGTFFAELADY